MAQSSTLYLRILITYSVYLGFLTELTFHSFCATAQQVSPSRRIKVTGWQQRGVKNYISILKADKKLIEYKNKTIVFDGLKVGAKIYLNDSLIGSSRDELLPLELPLKNRLLEGNNRFRVTFESVQGQVSAASFVAFSKPVSLEAYNDLRLKSFHILQRKLDRKQAELSCTLELEAKTQLAITVEVRVGQGALEQIFKKSFKVVKGKQINTDVVVNNPIWWCTNGTGPATLYPVHISILDTEGNLLDSASKKIGFRTLELVRKADTTGYPFYFKLNGQPLFIKGATYLPQDLPLTKSSRFRSERLIDAAVDAGMNMIRLWGGSIYENDYFYDYCDKRGILVWQDLVITSPLKRRDTIHQSALIKEAAYVLNRLRDRPSLALLSEHHTDAGKKKSAYLKEGFGIPKDSLPSAHGTDTVPSAFSKRLAAVFKGSGTVLVSTPEKAGHERFVTAYGTLSTGTLTISPGKRLLEGSDYKTLVAQGDFIGRQTEALRRSRNRCMGALLWRMNDPAPTPNSILDPSDAKKPSYFVLKHALAPVLLSPVVEHEKLVIYGVSDLLQEQNCEMKVSFQTFAGYHLLDKRFNVLIYPNVSRDYFSVPLKNIFSSVDSSSVFLKIALVKENDVLAENTFFFVPVKELALLLPDLTYTFQKAGKAFWVTVQSYRFAKNVWIGCKGTACEISDNCFDLPAGESKTVLVRPAVPQTTLKDKITLTSLNELYRP